MTRGTSDELMHNSGIIHPPKSTIDQLKRDLKTRGMDDAKWDNNRGVRVTNHECFDDNNALFQL